ncbi:MAG: MFS transporter [Firmicutes bacterium]|nr:MFS transporter [Bacillota bacterium]
MAVAVLCIRLVVIALDATIVNVAVPTIASKLHASEDQLQWIVDGYTLTFSVLLLTCGHMADRYGRQLGLIFGLILFGTGSTLATFAISPDQLIVWRAVMGAGAAFIMPATLSSISHIFRDPHERSQALGLWSATLGIGAILGPIVGGKLLQLYNWQSIFWVNVPIVMVGIALVIPFVPNSRHTGPRADLIGLFISALGLIALVWAIIEGPVQGWTSRPILLALLLAATGIIAFVVWELRVTNPLVPMHFFRNMRFSMASASISIAYFVLMGSLFLSTQYLQSILGNGPFATGLRLVPEAAAIAVFSLISSLAVRHTGTKLVVAAGLLITGASVWYLAHTTSSWSYIDILPALIGLGAGIGTTMAPCEESVIGSLPQSQTGVGSSVNSTLIQIGSTLGVAVFGSLENSGFHSHMSAIPRLFHLPSSLSLMMEKSISATYAVASKLGPAYVSAIKAMASRAFIHGMDNAMWIGMAVAAVAATLALALLPSQHGSLVPDMVSDASDAALE